MKYLNLPNSENIVYKKNFLNRVIVEVRFPILLEWENKIPPQLVNNLRNNYPHYEEKDDFNIGLSNMKSNKNYCLSSKDRKSLVVLRPSSFIFQTSEYEKFEKFKLEVISLSDKVYPFLETSFYTRVGLRLINIVPDYGSPANILNDLIYNHNVSNVFGEALEFEGRVNGKIDEENFFTFRHGINGTDKNQYVLDFDYYKEFVENNNLKNCLSHLHNTSFKFFNWVISDKLKEKMNAS